MYFLFLSVNTSGWKEFFAYISHRDNAERKKLDSDGSSKFNTFLKDACDLQIILKLVDKADVIQERSYMMGICLHSTLLKTRTKTTTKFVHPIGKHVTLTNPKGNMNTIRS